MAAPMEYGTDSIESEIEGDLLKIYSSYGSCLIWTASGKD